MFSTLAFSMPGGIEWIVILLIALLIFGPRLPRIMRAMGSSVREFRGGMDESSADSQGQSAPGASAQKAAEPEKSAEK